MKRACIFSVDVSIRLFLFFSFAFLAACGGEKKLHTNSMKDFIESRSEVRADLTYDQRLLFDEASRRLVLNHANGDKIVFLEFKVEDLARTDGSSVLPKFSEIFEGMTAQQVIDADKTLSENRKYMKLDTFSEMLVSLDSTKKQFPDEKMIEWRGQTATVGTIRQNVLRMNEQAELTLEALRLYD